MNFQLFGFTKLRANAKIFTLNSRFFEKYIKGLKIIRPGLSEIHTLHGQVLGAMD